MGKSQDNADYFRRTFQEKVESIEVVESIPFFWISVLGVFTNQKIHKLSHDLNNNGLDFLKFHNSEKE